MVAGSCSGDGRGMPPVRVLVVEHYEPFCRFVCSALEKIHKLSPESKILFVSQETATDVVEGAFGLGPMGYVAKANAGIELLAAVEAVSEGRWFVGAGLAGHSSAELADGQVS